MSRRHALLPVVCLVLAAACSDTRLEPLDPIPGSSAAPSSTATPDSSRTEEAPESPDAPETGPAKDDADPARLFDSVGIDWPDAALDDAEFASLPPAPAGFTESDIRRLAMPLQQWARRAALDPSVWQAKTPAVTVVDPLGPAAAPLRRAARHSVSPRLALANVFGPEVEILGPPRMTSAWRTDVVRTRLGPAVRLRLQTRTAYAVSTDGRRGVVGVVRDHVLGGPRGSGTIGALSTASWFEVGATGCALVTLDALVPQEATSAQDLAQFVRIGESDSYASPRLSSEQSVDADYARRCGVPSVVAPAVDK